jgi:large repetitive protein
LATQTYVNSTAWNNINASVTYAASAGSAPFSGALNSASINSSSLFNTTTNAGSISGGSIVGAYIGGSSSANFASASISGSAIATQAYVTSQGYLTSSGSIGSASNSASLGGTAASAYALLSSANFTAASVNSSPIVTQQTLQYYQWLPSSLGMTTWNFDPILAENSLNASAIGNQASGTIGFFQMLPVATTTINGKIYFNVTTSGSSLNTGSNFVGIYVASAASFVLTASSSDITSSIISAGAKSINVTGNLSLSSGSTYYVGMLLSASGTNNLKLSGGAQSAAINQNLSASVARFCYYSNNYTSLPLTVAASNVTALQYSYWAALS